MMSMAQEKELISKGYRVDSGYTFHCDALAAVKKYRENGYYARLAEYTTMIRGFHTYAVWYKKKGVTTR